jgi:hypothetical protein
VWKDGDYFPLAQFLSESESEPESDPWPQPNEDSEPEEENAGGWPLTYCEPVVIDTDENPLPSRPEWWSDNGSKLEGVSVEGVQNYVRPVCPKPFKEEVVSDVMAFDVSGA